ncbi:MAG: hypothetical protein R2848_17660 [Thermomicrobiales bacterium]
MSPGFSIRAKASGKTTSPAACSTGGSLAAMIECRHPGVTSNPTIFEKAISSGDIYRCPDR